MIEKRDNNVAVDKNHSAGMAGKLNPLVDPLEADQEEEFLIAELQEVERQQRKLRPRVRITELQKANEALQKDPMTEAGVTPLVTPSVPNPGTDKSSKYE